MSSISRHNAVLVSIVWLISAHCILLISCQQLCNKLLTYIRQFDILEIDIGLNKIAMIEETLKKLRFTEKEVDLYLAVLKNGKITPADLSKITGINRSTVYSVSGELIKKGVISDDVTGTTKYLIALSPEKLVNVAKKEEKKLVKKKQLITTAIKELKQVSTGTKYTVPKVRFIAENELENFLYKQTPKWNESMTKTKTAFLGFQDHTFVEYYSSWVEWYWNDAPKDITVNLLTNQSDIEKVLAKRSHPQRRMKFFKKSKPFTATTWVMGEYIVMIITNERPHYAIEIHNAELAKNQLELFRVLWGASFRS